MQVLLHVQETGLFTPGHFMRFLWSDIYFSDRFHLFSLVSLSFCDLVSVSFTAVCASACWRETRLLIRSDACCISAINPYPGYYNTPYSLLHTFIILTFGEEYNLHTWFQQPVQFGQKRVQTSSWSDLSDRIWMCLGCVSDASRKRLGGHLHRGPFFIPRLIHLRWFERFQIF